MTSKVDEIIASIPGLNIKLSDVFNFGDKCVDPLAVEIITESLNYALETSIRRLESVAKINPHIREAATENILPAVKTLRDLIEQAPRCQINALATAPITTAPPKVTIPKREKAETKTTKKKSAKKPAELIKNLSEAVAEAKKEELPTTVTDLKKQFGTKVKPGTESIGEGKQFTLKYDGQEKKFLVSSPAIMKLKKQVPEETGVEKLASDKALAISLMGKKAGEKFKLEVEGKEYNFEISDVKEGRFKKE